VLVKSGPKCRPHAGKKRRAKWAGIWPEMGFGVRNSFLIKLRYETISNLNKFYPNYKSRAIHRYKINA
jgi:hypothetical protein